MHSIAIFGGTFDPIHNGHLQTSLNIQAHFKFNSYVFLPCKVSPLKHSTIASDLQRIKMIELAIKNYADFKLDLREIERNSPSYMVNTLESFRREYPNSSITLIIGYDAFIALPHWHQWEKLITLAHILVIKRNQFARQKKAKLLRAFLDKHQSEQKTPILNQKFGTVILFDAGHYEISSTFIREEIKRNKEITLKAPDEVIQYIKDEGLYQ